MWEWLGGMFSGSRNPLDSIFEGIDKLTTSDEEKGQLRLEAVKLDLAKRQQDFDDKNSARNLYKDDSSMQKIFAFTFLLGYIGLSGFLLWWLMDGVELNQVTSNFVFTIFGAMSTKVSTIVDFFFGGSSVPQNTTISDKSIT